jgi:transglutaminase-like putative cysteine protease
VKAVTVNDQVPRKALVWIMCAQAALLLPHLGRIPLWVVAVYLVAAGWRWLVYQGRWSYPSLAIKALLALTGFAGIYVSFGSLVGLEPTVALLLVAFALKLIELARCQDAYVILFLGYFVCITAFLFSQGLPLVIYSILPVLLLTTALLAVHRPADHAFQHVALRDGAVLLLQAVPLMLVLFFLFPRIGPLWNVPLKSQAAKTGVSDFMKPGDISLLSQSDEVAFRVQFEGAIPPRDQLYWRGLVMSRLEDGAWRVLGYRDLPPQLRRPDEPALVGQAVRYSIIMAPTQQNWLYALRYAQPEERRVMSSSDFRLYSPIELQDEYRYRVTSWPGALLEPELSAWRREVELQLPDGDNPRSVQLARDLRTGAQSDQDYVASVLAFFNREEFVYTLQPPLLQGEHSMDQFLFETRRGFCEHYAYAFVVMMRAAGIPARVVSGYQGGEVNPVNRTVIVHQFDAHAWAEVWLPGRGWVRIDPTASVAPERIEWGLEQAVAQEGSFLADSPLSPLRFRHVQWLNRMRLRYDALIYNWQSWILGFDRQAQYDFLKNVLGEVNVTRFAAVMVSCWVLVMLPLAWRLLYRRQPARLSAAERLYRQFLARLAAARLAREPGEGPRTFAARVAAAYPDLADLVWRITRLYEALRYAAPGSDSQSLERELASAVRDFRVRPGA